MMIRIFLLFIASAIKIFRDIFVLLQYDENLDFTANRNLCLNNLKSY